MGYNELRIEYNRPSFKKHLHEVLGDVCVNCGSTEDVEFHHIVPLRDGGTNTIGNIVPLCYRCHQATHGSRKSWISRSARSERTGRPRKISYEDAEPTLDKYFRCEIGSKEAWDTMGFTGDVKLSGTLVFKQYVKEHHITAYRNNIDIIRKKNDGVIPFGHKLGYIIIGNGEPEFFGNT